eukprot:jgi/Tetstr1/442545/TSEL_030643.t1
METDSLEKQLDAGVGTFLAALRGGNDAPHVALLFGNLVAQHQAMDEESRSRTVTNLIRTLSPKIGVQILPADVRVVTRRPPKPAAAHTAEPIGTRLPTTTGSVILRLARRDTAESVLHTQWTGEGTAILDRQGRRCSTRLLGAPHLDDIERPVHQVWLRSPSFKGLTEADMWLRLAEGLLPAYDQPQPCEAAANQPAATPADVLSLAGVRAWAEYEADTDADDAVICPPTRTLLALPEVREVWKARLTESEFDPSELLIHPFNQTIREAGELGGNTGYNQIRRAAIGLRKKARKTAPASLAPRATGRPIYTLTMQMTAHHHSIIGGTRSTDITEQWRKTVSTTCGKIKAAPAPAPAERRPADTSPAPPPAATAPAATATTGAHADEEEELELNYEENDSAMEVDTTQGEAAETPGPADISLDSPQRSTVNRTFREGTPNGTTERLADLHHLITAATELLAESCPASKPTIVANLASLTAESHQLRNPQRLSIQRERHPSQPNPASKGKSATTAKPKKKKSRGRSRSDGATRNRIRSKPCLSDTHGSDSEWETDEEAAHPSSSSHQ